MDSTSEIVEEAVSELKKSESKPLQKDSKRSWLVCFGAMFLVGVSIGLCNSFGVLFTSWTKEFQESRSKIGGYVEVYLTSVILCCVLYYYVHRCVSLECLGKTCGICQG